LRSCQQRRRLQRFEPSLDRVNSAVLIERARRVFWRYWQQGAAPSAAPCGVVLQGNSGKVVFDLTALLPDEEFVPVEWIQGRGTAPSGRSPRTRTG